jgi:hypothetical protein
MAEPGREGEAMIDRSAQWLPCTRAIAIGGGVFYRPIRSWHSGTYAGERLTIVRGDKSGCMMAGGPLGRDVAPLPNTATHRLYWHKSDPDAVVSAFLSYPGGMGCCDEYFWETNIGDCERFTGPSAEEEMEASIRKHLKPKRKRGGAA